MNEDLAIDHKPPEVIDLTSSPSPELDQQQRTVYRKQEVCFIDLEKEDDASTLLNQFQSHSAAASGVTGRQRPDGRPQRSTSDYNPGAGTTKTTTSSPRASYSNNGHFHLGSEHNRKRHIDGEFKYGALKSRGAETSIKGPLISSSPVPVRMPPSSTNSANRNGSSSRLPGSKMNVRAPLISSSPVLVRMPPSATGSVVQSRHAGLKTSNTGLTPLTSTPAKMPRRPEIFIPKSEKPAQPPESSHQQSKNRSNNTEEQSHLAAESSFGKDFSSEEDSLLVYLKQCLGWNWQDIAAATNGRTPGSCQTRYCKKLKRELSVRSSIANLETSSFRRFLRPDLHAEMLVQSSTVHQARASHYVGSQQQSIASGRERRAAFKKTTYYPAMFEMDVPITDHTNSDPVLPSHVATTSSLQPRRSKRIEYQKLPPKLPYLSRNDRIALRQGLGGTWSSRQVARWKGTALHFPFTSDEITALKNILVGTPAYGSTSQDEKIETMMHLATEAEIYEYASIVHEEKVLKDRTKESIEAFFRDASQGFLDDAVLRIGSSVHVQSTQSLLRQRELGSHNTRGLRLSSRGAFMKLRTRILQTLGPSFSFTGTSGDVNTVAWAPDGIHFAAGSACLVDNASMQYNRPNNLLFGDMAHQTLQELPDHHTRRKKTESGVNATHSMFATQDKRLFQTVSMVDFSPGQEFMYTAGYDKKVRVWNIRNGVEDEPLVIKHKGKVDLLAVSKTGILATGTQRTQNAIKLMGFSRCGDSNISGEHKGSFSSRKALDRPENEIYPSALRFSPSGEHLLGGFSSSSQDEQVRGETCVWDLCSGQPLPVYPETRNVFDCAWHPMYRTLFAVGCVAGTNVNRGIRSVVRLYDWRANQSKYDKWLELECEALDMNDLVYSPYDEYLVSAGCTNGKTYVWDVRNPDDVLLTLRHGQPLMEFGELESQEKLDTGIRFASWGHDRSCFYTGSSDGVLKSWNLYRAPEDVHQKDVITLNSGIMTGALSPDYSSLLLGEVNGSVNVLEVGQSDRALRDMRRLKLMPAFGSDPLAQLESSENVVGEGVLAARDMLSSGQITTKPIRSLPVRQAVQGPNYKGPYDGAPDADLLRARASNFHLESNATDEDQCEINECRDISHVTSEEAGDSGRSIDRIPGALRFVHLSNDAGKPTAKCKKCGAPARPRLAEKDSISATLFCERCDFTCLACGHQAEIVDGTTEFVGCNYCHGLWRADVLGYRVVDKPVPLKKERSISLRTNDLEYDGTYMGPDCEEEYFQSLWTDSPPSPL